MPGVFGSTPNDDGANASTDSSSKTGVFGINNAKTASPPGIPGGNGVFGVSSVPNAAGVFGVNNDGGNGVNGFSRFGDGLSGTTEDRGHWGAYAQNVSKNPPINQFGCGGVLGRTFAPKSVGICGADESTDKDSAGLYGISSKGVGVQGQGTDGFGGLFKSEKTTALVAVSRNGQGISAFAENDIGIFSEGGKWAAVFTGAVVISRNPKKPTNPGVSPNDVNGGLVLNDGDLFLNKGSMYVEKGDIVLKSADCAEEFNLAPAAQAEPGTVMIITSSGELAPCEKAYDKRVAGVISGAGTYKPAMILDRQPEATTHRMPVALVGKVFCKVDAQFGAIEVGDLLTTSSTLGHAQKASEDAKSIGSLLGKALASHSKGTGLIPILIALQ